MIPEHLNEPINGAGISFTFLAIFLNIADFFTKNINIGLTVIISILSITYLIMRIYDQFLKTKEWKYKHTNSEERHNYDKKD